jgi:hypothetical protein
MTATLTLPSKWDSFKQAVCMAYACDKKHKTACFKVCQNMATQLHTDSGFVNLPDIEKSLFDLISNAVARKYKKAVEDEEPVMDFYSYTGR